LGIIQKQAIKGTVYSYLGVGIGFITTVIIYPEAFSTSEIGLLRLLIAYSTIFSQLATLGFPRVTTMMFTYFRDKEKKHHGFMFIAIMVNLAGLIISLLLLFIFKGVIIGNEGKSELLARFFYYIIPLLVFSLFYNLFDNYYKVLYNSVQGTFLKEFIQRIIIMAGATLFLFNVISFTTYLLVFLVAFLVPPAVLFVLLKNEGEFSLTPDLKFLDKNLRKKLFNVSLFGILTSFSGILVLNIDSIMIIYYLNLSLTGIYATTFFFGQLILIPSRSLLKISSVVIADSWKTNDINTINTIYFKSCLNQLIIGGLFLAGIWGNIDNIFNEHFLGSKFEPGKYVILFISIASLIQMAGGTSNMILFTSALYRVHTYFMLLLIVLLVASNMVLIPVAGITGAAIASALSFLIFNIIKYLYLKHTFRFKPYNYKSILAILVIVASYLASLAIPQFENFIIDIIVRSSFITFVYLGLIVLLGISEEIDRYFYNFINYFSILPRKRK